MIYRIYEWLIERQLRCLPGHICLMITDKDVRDAPGKLVEFTKWSRDISERVSAGCRGTNGCTIETLTFHISTQDSSAITPFLPEIRRISSIARLVLHFGDREIVEGTGIGVTVAVGKSGREEILSCIRRIAEEGIPPEEVTEETIESRLTFRCAPDLMIKTGGYHLTDFLIWQSVYSELFFSDVNWRWMRKVDFLRGLRDYQSRVRKFGK
jgi:undecaprenyl diphosphate synthase